jgi:hypothetical protein
VYYNERFKKRKFANAQQTKQAYQCKNIKEETTIISPPGYLLFPKLKMKLKGLHFADVAEIQETVTGELKKVQKEKFSVAFQSLYDRAKAYICHWSLF